VPGKTRAIFRMMKPA